jgi:copper chaperone
MPSVAVKGMHCENCRKAVHKAVAGLSGLTDVEVDLKKGEVRWKDASPETPVAAESVKKAVSAIGFEAP